MIRRFLRFLPLVIIIAFTITFSNPAAAPQATSTYLVDSDADHTDANIGDGVCDTGPGMGNVCTLRAAIQEANRDGQASNIVFDSPMAITYATLEVISEANTTIDGGSQWDGSWPDGRPGVSIGGGGYTNGLLNITGDNTRIYGLQFDGGGNTGIRVEAGSGTQIGGLDANQRNVFIPLSTNAIGVLLATYPSDVSIVGNYFGTADGVTPQPLDGDYGVYLSTFGTTILENVIGGQSEAGIYISGGGGHIIENNLIGVAKTRASPLPNKIGISLDFSNGSTIGPLNVITGNTSHGILLSDSDYNDISGNRVGDMHPNSGDGIRLERSDFNTIGRRHGSYVAENDGNGISLINSNDNVIKGQGIVWNSGPGVYIQNGLRNIIGGKTIFESNVISENFSHGMHLDTGADSTEVLGNFIGFDLGASSWAGNSGHGILISNGATNNHIGGLDPGAGNYIGWNHQTGIMLTGAGTTGNVVDGNIVGAPQTWLGEAPNGHHGIGLYDGASGNWIGTRNTIVGSGWSGVAIVNTGGNVVWYNNIGTDGADHTFGNKFFGVHIVNGAGNAITNNRIANNGTHASEAGVRVDGAASLDNFISVNSIFENGTLGIELINGGNAPIAAPTISSGGCSTTVTGTACPGCLVEIFSDGADEGKYFEGSVWADGTTGAFSWSGAPMGPNITATASYGLFLSTSQFSAPYAIGVCNNAPTASFTVTPPDPSRCSNVTYNATGSSDPEDPVSSLQVRWDWNNDGVYETEWTSEKIVVRPIMSYAYQVIRLQVKDSFGAMDAATQGFNVWGDSCLYNYLPMVMD